ncbi:hypothetical protein Lal_00012746 [Lupinus albus]|nr:hypothetical protein Lal_00012746 [Lupinus albus]
MLLGCCPKVTTISPEYNIKRATVVVSRPEGNEISKGLCICLDECGIRIRRLNIGTLRGKYVEIVDTMIRRMNNFCVDNKLSGLGKDKEIRHFKFYIMVHRIEEKFIYVKVVTKEDTFNVISAYAPRVGLDECVVQMIPLGENIFLEGDLNWHVRRDTRVFEGVHGEYGIKESNLECQIILDFSSPFDFTIANMCFNMGVEIILDFSYHM